MKKQRYIGIQKEKRVAWLRMKAQAKYRNENFCLTWDDFQCLWTDELWANRGMESTQLAMTRIDPANPWALDNVKIVERQEHLAYWAKKTRTGYKKSPKNPSLSPVF